MAASRFTTSGPSRPPVDRSTTTGTSDDTQTVRPYEQDQVSGSDQDIRRSHNKRPAELPLTKSGRRVGVATGPSEAARSVAATSPATSRSQPPERPGSKGLRFHDLRHTAATLAVAAGASTSELMMRMGHSSSAAALRYQHVMAGRDAAIAAALDELVQAASTRSEDPAAGRSGTRAARTGQHRRKGKRR
jgi:hypothetical protein